MEILCSLIEQLTQFWPVYVEVLSAVLVVISSIKIDDCYNKGKIPLGKAKNGYALVMGCYIVFNVFYIIWLSIFG